MSELPLLAAGQIWRRRDGTLTEPLKEAGPCTCLCNRGWIFGNQYDASAYYAFAPTTPSVHDLMALVSDPTLPDFSQPATGYVTKDSGSRVEFATGSVRDTTEGKGSFVSISPHMLRRLAALMERGAKKYGLFNWQKGQPLSRIADSLMRHTNQARMGDKTEDHAAAVVFNAMAWIHMEEEIAAGRLPAELDDLPRYTP